MTISKKLRLIARQAKGIKNRYRTTQYPFNIRRTWFLPIRHFNSDSPITPGAWANLPYCIAKKPIDFEENGKSLLKPILIGGGYYLWHWDKQCGRGYGIVIDPGYGFVHSLYHYHGITVSYIDAIIITHDHMDHHADLETIITLKKKQEESLKIFTTGETARSYGLEHRSKPGKELSKLTFKELNPSNTHDGNNQQTIVTGITAKILPCMHWQRYQEEEDFEKILDCHFNAFGVQLEMTSLKKRILITGDTLFPVYGESATPDKKISDQDHWYAYSHDEHEKIPYLIHKKATMLGWLPKNSIEDASKMIPKIQNQCKKMVSAYQNLEKSDIVCLHIGSIKGMSKITTKKNVLDIDNPDFCYPGFHLGFTGCLRVMDLLIKNNSFDLQNGLVVVSEFGEELLGNRKLICDSLAECIPDLKKIETDEGTMADQNKTDCHEESDKIPRISVLPSELTLRIEIKSNQVESDQKGAQSNNKESQGGIYCSYCGELHPWSEICCEEGPGEIISFTSRDEIRYSTERFGR